MKLKPWLLEHKVTTVNYDCVSTATPLGWALRTWCSPELIAELLAAGARTDSQISTDSLHETLRAFLRRLTAALAKDTEGILRDFQEEFYGRAPSDAWFVEVERMLVAAGAPE